MNEWFLCTVWNEGVKRLDVVKETPKTLILKNGNRIPKRYSRSQFVGNTREEAKLNLITVIQEDLNIELRRVENLKQRIEQIKRW
jgi:hypothetical protein